jgi:glycosyltransferase involved in cell wall biosynthesis
VARALWLTAEVPDAGGGGGNIRQYNLLRALAGAMPTDLVVVGRLPDVELRASLGRVVEVPAPPPPVQFRNSTVRRAFDVYGIATGRPDEVLVERLPRRALARALAELGGDAGYDVVQVEHASMAPLVSQRRAAPWSLTVHNVASARARQMAAVVGGRRRWLYEQQAKAAARHEAWIARTFDAVLAVSDADAELLPGAATVIDNGVDTSRFQVTPLPAEPRMLLSASWNYPPNVDGATWFCHEVLPLVRAACPDARLSLVGREPTAAVRALGELPGVDASFDVPSVHPFLTAARVAVVPLRIGTGTRLKALEAMAAGRPLAGTSIGLEGLGLEAGRSAAIADDPAELAAGIAALLTDAAVAERSAAAARRLVDERFAWDLVGARLVATLTALAAGGRRLAA